MTEEQFIVADCSTCVFDKVTEEEYVCINREEAFLVCNRFNALCKEKEELLDERNYFERKKCEYFNDWNNAHLDNIQLKKENEQLKSRINDLELILGIQSDITPVYWGDRNFNCCILDLIGNGKQRGVLNYLYNHYRKNDYEIKRFDNILREHKVKYGKYGWEKER